jgi:hypothetical protein
MPHLSQRFDEPLVPERKKRDAQCGQTKSPTWSCAPIHKPMATTRGHTTWLTNSATPVMAQATLKALRMARHRARSRHARAYGSGRNGSGVR